MPAQSRVGSPGGSLAAKGRVAVIGLGSMGFGMALSLKRAGFDVAGCDVAAEAVARFVGTAGAVHANPAEPRARPMSWSASSSTPPRPRRILFAPHGVARPCRRARCSCPRQPWTRTWRVALPNAWKRPAALSRCADQRRAQRAAQGELTFLASAARRRSPGRGRARSHVTKLYELGDAPGQGAAFKLINKLLAGVHIAAASEAMAFAARQGLDLRKVYEVITASAGNSWMFENSHAPRARWRL